MSLLYRVIRWPSRRIVHSPATRDRVILRAAQALAVDDISGGRPNELSILALGDARLRLVRRFGPSAPHSSNPASEEVHLAAHPRRSAGLSGKLGHGYAYTAGAPARVRGKGIPDRAGSRGICKAL